MSTSTDHSKWLIVVVTAIIYYWYVETSTLCIVPRLTQIELQRLIYEARRSLKGLISRDTLGFIEDEDGDVWSEKLSEILTILHNGDIFNTEMPKRKRCHLNEKKARELIKKLSVDNSRKCQEVGKAMADLFLMKERPY